MIKSNNEKANTIQSPVTGVNYSQTAIQHSYDYSNFEPLGGQRTINEKKVETLVESFERTIKSFGFFPFSNFAAVIKKQGRYLIIDGQHRVAAWQDLGLPVAFIEIGATIKQAQQYMIAINSKASQWKMEDYLSFYCRVSEKSEYIKIQEALDNYGIPSVSTLKRLMSNGTDKDFKEGNFTITNKGWEETIIEAKHIGLEGFGHIKTVWKTRSFLTALDKIRKDSSYSRERMSAVLSNNSNTVKHMTKGDGVEELLIEMYNKGLRTNRLEVK